MKRSKKKMSKALVTGSYDPITVGHLDIIKRTAEIFDEVTVLISRNSSKEYLLCTKKRKLLVEDAVKELKNVTVDIDDGLVADYAMTHGVTAIVKGIRNVQDFDYENQMTRANEILGDVYYGKKCETMYLLCNPQFEGISSTLVRVMLKKGTGFEKLVPNPELLKKQFTK